MRNRSKIPASFFSTSTTSPTEPIKESEEKAAENSIKAKVDAETEEKPTRKYRKKENNALKTPVAPSTAFKSLKNLPTKRKFDETVEFVINLQLDPRKQTEQLRVVADLPFGTGKQTRVIAFTSDEEQAIAAKAAGCEFVGGVELIDEIQRTQNTNFDKAVATQDILPALAKVARLLGPRGLMPSKKLGSVVTDLAAAVQRAKAGSVELRLDRGATIHCGIGKLSMTDDALLANLKAIVLCIENNKPIAVKGRKWVKSAYLTSSMGPSFKISLIHLDPKNARFMASD
jgi:large subunit ribosomal protein L1